MKYLKIEDDKAFFSTKTKSDTPIDQISKDDLLELLSTAIDEDDFIMDTYEPDTIQNQAHRIIYEHIHKKFRDLRDNRTQFIDAADKLHKAAFEKYSITEPDVGSNA